MAQPDLLAGNIRDGITILGQEGELDLPDEADVKDKVKFDGETKEGTYKVSGGKVIVSSL